MPRAVAAKDGSELIYKRVGDAVRRARGRLTQSELADLVTVDQRTLSDYENGKSPIPLHVIVAIEDALQLPCGLILRQADLISEDVEAILASDPNLKTDDDRYAVVSFYRFTRDQFGR